MVERDVRQHDHLRVEDIGRVEPPAQARLHDRDVHLRRRELGERGRGEDLELRRAQPLGRLPHPR